MSDPLSIGLAALSGFLSIAQGNAEAKSLNRQANQREADANEEADRRRRDARRIIGQNRANIGASGISLEGSPLEVLADNAAEGELDARTAIVAGARDAANLRSRASAARSSGFIGAGSALLGSSFGKFGSTTTGSRRVNIRVGSFTTGGVDA